MALLLHFKRRFQSFTSYMQILLHSIRKHSSNTADIFSSSSFIRSCEKSRYTHMHKCSKVLVSVVCAAVSIKYKDPLKKSQSAKVTTAAAAACHLR